jgi:hypothetical protein
MATAGGGAGGTGGQGQQLPPRVFTKLATRYDPLVLPVPLHDLPKKYMKNLPKFTGEGDLTAVEHMNFFDQFVDILGLEHEDVYSHLFFQTFEGQVRTWFHILAPGLILSYNVLEDIFLKQWGEKKGSVLLFDRVRKFKEKGI